MGDFEGENGRLFVNNWRRGDAGIGEAYRSLAEKGDELPSFNEVFSLARGESVEECVWRLRQSHISITWD